MSGLLERMKEKGYTENFTFGEWLALVAIFAAAVLSVFGAVAFVVAAILAKDAGWLWWLVPDVAATVFAVAALAYVDPT